MHPLKQLFHNPSLITSLPHFFFTSTWLYLSLCFLLVIFTLPLLWLFKAGKSKISFLLPVLGFSHLLVVLALFSSLVDLINVPVSYLLPVILVYGLSFSALTVVRIKPEIIGFKQFFHTYGKQFLLHFFLFLLLSFSAYDVLTRNYFVPGFRFNHDSMNILSSAVVLKDNHFLQTNIAANVGKTFLNLYPLGGTYLAVLVSDVTRLEPYAVYHRLIVFFYLLLIFPISSVIFPENKDPRNIHYLLKWGIVLASVLSFVAVDFLNVAVLGSTLSSTLAITWLVLLLAFYKKSIRSREFMLASAFLVIGNMFIYIYYSLPLLFGAAITYLFLEKDKLKRWLPLFSIVIGIVLSILLPSIRQSTFTMGRMNVSSTDKEFNLMGGATGNTQGFINPLAGLSLWSGQHNFPFAFGNTLTLYGAFGFLFLQAFSVIKNPPSKEQLHTLLFIGATYLPLIVITYAITKSPYQNVKAYQYAGAAIPIIIYLLNPLNIKQRLPTLVLSAYLMLTAMSAFFSYIHIQAPPRDSYTNPLRQTPCRSTASPEKPFDWYDYVNIGCDDN